MLGLAYVEDFTRQCVLGRIERSSAAAGWISILILGLIFTVVGEEVREIDSERRYAGVWPRFGALVADFALLSAVFFPVTHIVKGTWLMTAEDHRWASGWFVTDPLCLIFLLVIFLYFVLMEGLAGGTVGKKMLNLRIISVDGGSVGLGKALLRNLLRIVDALPVLNILGIVLIIRTGEKTRFGDRVAGTRVVHDQR